MVGYFIFSEAWTPTNSKVFLVKMSYHMCPTRPIDKIVIQHIMNSHVSKQNKLRSLLQDAVNVGQADRLLFALQQSCLGFCSLNCPL